MSEGTQRRLAAIVAATVRWFRKQGIGIKRVMPNNGSCYKAATFAEAC